MLLFETIHLCRTIRPTIVCSVLYLIHSTEMRITGPCRVYAVVMKPEAEQFRLVHGFLTNDFTFAGQSRPAQPFIRIAQINRAPAAALCYKHISWKYVVIVMNHWQGSNTERQTKCRNHREAYSRPGRLSTVPCYCTTSNSCMEFLYFVVWSVISCGRHAVSL